MSTLKEEREAIARDIHFKYLAKAKTAKIDGSELTVLPYGYLSQAVEEALLSHEEKVMERVRSGVEGMKVWFMEEDYHNTFPLISKEDLLDNLK